MPDTLLMNILIIDNDAAHAETVAESLQSVGHHCTVATSGPEGARLIQEGEADIVITDLMMPEIDGLEIVRRTKSMLPDVEVIMVTGHGTIDSAVTAIKEGAFHYLLKPLDIGELRAITQRAAQKIELKRTNVELIKRLDEKFGFEGIIGNSQQMKNVIERMRRIASTDATTLIQGVTGTGKELIAQAIHQNSPRKNKQFVALNCAALSENILESELFGHIKGAFTGADHDRVGKFEFANGGSLFLDEVGDMPMQTQIKLLRVLESSEITRVGSNEVVKVNVRIISATNRDLEEIIAEGKFRSDLYHRLKVVTIQLPALKERSQDIPLLIEHFIKQFTKRHNKLIKGMSTAARRRLIAYDWPGNVRQLKNFIESMVVVDFDSILDVDDLPSELADEDQAKSPTATVGDNDLIGQPISEIERYYIGETLKLTGGNREETAKILGIGQRTLYRKIKEYEI